MFSPKTRATIHFNSDGLRPQNVGLGLGLGLGLGGCGLGLEALALTTS